MTIQLGLLADLIEMSPICRRPGTSGPVHWWNQVMSNAPVDAQDAAVRANLIHQYDTQSGKSRFLSDFPGTNFLQGDERRSNMCIDLGGGGSVGIPYFVVTTDPSDPNRTPYVTNIHFDTNTYSNEIDYGYGGIVGYPIPEVAKTDPRYIEQPPWIDENSGNPGGDAHMLILDRYRWLLYELAHMNWNPPLYPGVWSASVGCIWDLNKQEIRPYDPTRGSSPTYGYGSTDAAGLQVLPGLLRFDEAYKMVAPIHHAFRFSVRGTGKWVYPATHTGNVDVGVNGTFGDGTNGQRIPLMTGFSARVTAPVDDLPHDGLPLGLRLRLKASFDIDAHLATTGITANTSPGNQKPTGTGVIWTHYQAMVRVFQALKDFGIMLADRGGNMYIQGTNDTGWNNTLWNPVFKGNSANSYNGLNANDFETIQLGYNTWLARSGPRFDGPIPSDRPGKQPRFEDGQAGNDQVIGEVVDRETMRDPDTGAVDPITPGPERHPDPQE